MEAVSFYLIAASGSNSQLLGTSSTGLRAVRGVLCFVGTIKMTYIILPSLLVALSILNSVQGVPYQAAEQPHCQPTKMSFSGMHDSCLLTSACRQQKRLFSIFSTFNVKKGDSTPRSR